MSAPDITYTRTRRRPSRTVPGSTQTPERTDLARIDADLRAVLAALENPQGWEDELRAELGRLTRLRAEKRAPVATTALAA